MPTPRQVHLLALIPLSIALSIITTTPAHAQRDLTDIPDPDPVAERAAMRVDSAVEVNLFASDPMIRKPIQSNFDSLGRMWVASSESYPQLAPGEKADDKILVLADTDGDGVADQSTVFADGLLIPTGVVPDGTSAAYVAHATELLYLQDTDGDGRADRRQVVLSGFGTEDTHHLLHTLRWGPDGCLYFNQSIYIHSTIETAYGTRRLDGGGIWRYRPETGQLEVFCKGFVNPWGHVFDAFGQSLATDGAYFEGINHVFPDSVFVTSPGAPRWLGGMNPGSPKHCGLTIISGDHFPESWQGDFVTNDFRSHRVCRFTLKPENSSYVSRQQPELIASSHIAFRPIDASIGGDGALYVSDWYNPIIQHGEVDFRDERRDRSRGRIWRISAKEGSLSQPPAYETLDINSLLDLLRQSDLNVRQFARLELKTRTAVETLAALNPWVDDSDSATERELREMESMWIELCHNQVNPERIGKLMTSDDGRVRAAAVRTIGMRRGELAAADDWLAQAVADSHPQVRLEAVAALGRGQNAKDAEVALRVLTEPLDENLDFSLWNTIRNLSGYWNPKLAEGQFDFGNDPQRLVFLLSAAGSPAAAAPVIDAVGNARNLFLLLPDQRAALVSPLAGIADANQLSLLTTAILESPDWSVEQQAELLDGLVTKTAQRGLVPTNIEPLILQTLARVAGDESTLALRGPLVRAAGAWKLTESVSPIAEFLTKASEAPALRATAINALGAIATPAAIEVLTALAADVNADSDDRALAVVSLVGPSQEIALSNFISLISDDTTRPAMIEQFGSTLSVKGFADPLASALASQKLPTDDARRMLQIARGAGVLESLQQAIRAAGSLDDASWVWSSELRDSILTMADAEGSAERGETIYRREKLQCIKCHAIGSGGGLVGPNLVSLGGGSTPEYILQSLIEPNDKLKEGFNTVQVLTIDGRVIQGIPAGGDQETLQLRDAEGKLISIARSDIEDEVNGQSLMPVGLVDVLTRAELADLTCFLTKLGRTPEYTVSTKQVIRTVETLVYNNETNTLLNRTSNDSVTSDAPFMVWRPLTSRVDGTLPIAEMDRYQQYGSVIPPSSYIKFQPEVDASGILSLNLSSTAGVEMWVDGKPTPVVDASELSLSPGIHTIILAINRNLNPTGISIEQ